MREVIEKVIGAEKEAKAIVDKAEEEARALLSEARSKAHDEEERRRGETLKEASEIISSAEGKAVAESDAAIEDYRRRLSQEIKFDSVLMDRALAMMVDVVTGRI